MKIYLEFSVDGDIVELKTKDKVIESNNYDYKYIENISYNKYNFVLLYNNNNDNDNDCKKNITNLPFIKKDIHGKFVIFMVDSENNIKSFNENKLLNLINIKPQNNEDIDNYSSDDFNLSD
jgi:hypothetical protein